MSWEAVNRQYREISPNFLRLTDLILTIPATSSEAERGFSAMGLVKTDNRNRMEETSLNTLLRIVLLSPPVEVFDPQPSVNLWWEDCKRREGRPPVAPVAAAADGTCNDEDNIWVLADSDSDN